ncbi:hypothetical protein ABZY45_32720 [Streptomyces sp. NPDC006516]|uniref:hypothetical protein n=1 Tax=Streptomyces sp. NPDC006516 TaxID=3154309 RepID=UPI0033ABFDC2
MSSPPERLTETQTQTQTRETEHPVPSPAQPAVVPFITQRKGEEAAADNLILVPSRHGRGRYRLFYEDEDPKDRDLRQVLWGRVSFNDVDEHRRPTGEPEWKLMHPFRQRITMETLRCQVCTAPAATVLGTVFLAGAHDYERREPPLLTNQPPVCPKHVRTAAALCAHLRNDPVVFLATSAPLYGVLGTLYGLVDGKVDVVTQPKEPLPYGHPNLPTFLASQLVRRLSRFRVLTVGQRTRELAELPT